jgi:hypothetical protein
VIALTRDRTSQAIPPGFRGTGRVGNQRRLIDLRLAKQGPKSSVWGAAKAQLRAESGGKCAYCEGKASHVAHGDVEHMRPKADYWWLAYCYDNYLYACQLCNQSFKGTNFPITGARLAEPLIPPGATDAQLDTLAPDLCPDPLEQAAVAQYAALVGAEQAGIPDPYLLDPEPFFSWKPDDTLREVEVQPRDASAAAQRAFAAAEAFLGLNRDELKLWRYEVYEDVALLIEIVDTPRISAALRHRTEDILRRKMSVRGEFAGMVRYFVRDVAGLPL